MTNPAPQYRALIVEDDPAIRRLLVKLLSRRGIDTDAVEDGRTAVERVRDREYSVVVLDLMLPEMNGFAVLDEFKSMGHRMPVAVVSAVSQQALTELDLDIVKLVVSKPFDVDQLTKSIFTLCEEHGPLREVERREA